MRGGSGDGIVVPMIPRTPIRRAFALLGGALALACAAASGGAAGAGEPAGSVRSAQGAVSAETFPDTLPERLSRTLEGTIGERPVAFDLRIEDGGMSGRIRPVGPPAGELHGGPWLSGSVEPDGSVSLEENDEGTVARIEGRLAIDAGRLVLEGERRPVDGDGIRTVRLAERVVELGPGARLASRDVRVSDTTRAIVFYAEAPRVVEEGGGSPADPSLERLDAALRERIATDREWFVESFARVGRDSAMERIVREMGPSWYESSYDAWIAAERVLSVEATVSTYGAGAAHPSHHTWTLVWDLEAGAELELEDLFRAQSAWLDTLSRRAVDTLVRERLDMSDEEWIRSGAGPEPENFSAWTVVPGGIRIVFDPYQVAAYAAGPQVVVVPWASLASVLAPDGPVATPGEVGLPSDASTGRSSPVAATGPR